MPDRQADLMTTTPVELSERDRAMLSGELGGAARRAMRIVVRLAEVQRAPRLIDIARVHVSGSIYTGPGSLRVLEQLLADGARVRVPTTLNPISVERGGANPGLDAAFVRDAERMGAVLEAMGCRPLLSCTPYAFPDPPGLGEDVLWAESNAIVYANSVLGARTNRHGDFMDVFAAITGRVPCAGLHLPENRTGQVLVDLPDIEDPDPTLFAVLGYLVGQAAGEQVPVVRGIRGTPSLEAMKAFCSTVATSGAVGLFHMVGVTPEAPTLEAALRGNAPSRTVTVTRDDLRRVWEGLSSTDGDDLDVVLIGSPHATLGDFAELAELVHGRKKDPRVDVIVTTSRPVRDQAAARGLLDGLLAFGARVRVDTCLCMLTEPQLRPGAVGVMTSSGKFAHYGPGLVNRGVRFGSTRDCVESAVRGLVVVAEPEWLLGASEGGVGAG